MPNAIHAFQCLAKYGLRRKLTTLLALACDQDRSRLQVFPQEIKGLRPCM